MKKLGLIAFASLMFVACNNSGDETRTTDSTSIQNNTNTTAPAPLPPDSSMNSNMGDTSKMKDSVAKKDKKY